MVDRHGGGGGAGGFRTNVSFLYTTVTSGPGSCINGHQVIT